MTDHSNDRDTRPNDEVDDMDLRALYAAFAESMRQAEAGESRPASEVLAELRRRRLARAP